ncbi:MAG TPA: sugar ABC transporter permease [Treponemataceae bacterium]|nr:sugar ABC transporter permease [Treponemataceae bacterium]
MKRRGKALLSFLLMGPSLLLLAFFFFPTLGSVLISLTDRKLVGQNAAEISFVGLNNYLHLFADSNLPRVLANTSILILSAVAIQQALGYFISRLLKDKAPRFRRIVHGSLYAGLLMPEAATAFIFFLLFSFNGELNRLIAAAGGIPRVWLADRPLLIVCIALIWSGTAYSVITFENALDSLNESVSDSARCDGAGLIRLHFGILIPAIRRTILANTTILALNGLGAFGLIFMLTGGGPLYRSTTLSVLVFRNAVSGSDVGYGLALSFLLFLISLSLGSLQAALIRSSSENES